MSYKFKEGDALICIDNKYVEDELTIGEEYVVDKILVVRNTQYLYSIGNTKYYDARCFKLKEETLPEIGDTMYRYEVIPGLATILRAADAKEYDQVLLVMEERSNNHCASAIHMKLDADDALDLAHDLVRMAMQIKRRTK